MFSMVHAASGASVGLREILFRSGIKRGHVSAGSDLKRPAMGFTGLTRRMFHRKCLTFLTQLEVGSPVETNEAGSVRQFNRQSLMQPYVDRNRHHFHRYERIIPPPPATALNPTRSFDSDRSLAGALAHMRCLADRQKNAKRIRHTGDAGPLPATIA